MAIVESMFDLVNAQGHFPRQHVVEFFSGKGVDLERWFVQQTVGTSTFQISDSINGGFEILSGSSTTADFDFGTVRQYSPFSSVFRTVVKSEALVDNQTVTGMTDDNFVNDYYVLEAFESFTNYQLLHRGTTGARVDTGIPADTIYHQWKGEAFSASVTLSESPTDNLVATATTDIPLVKLEPHFRQRSFSAASQSGNWLWYEAFNK